MEIDSMLNAPEGEEPRTVLRMAVQRLLLEGYGPLTIKHALDDVMAEFGETIKELEELWNNEGESYGN